MCSNGACGWMSPSYDKIRRDKLDDGIIQNNLFGVKERGYLTPRYLMPTTGGAIPVVKE